MARPSSHLITGVVLRALAAEPSFRRRAVTHRAALLLAERFFRKDTYVDRRDSRFWTKLSFPFRWTDLVSSLDSMALVGLRSDQPDVAKGIRWLTDHQLASGLWRAGYLKSPDPLLDHWVTFAATRMLKRFFGAAILQPWANFTEAPRSNGQAPRVTAATLTEADGSRASIQ